jgi:phosphatidylglycerophosphatase A
LKASEKNRAKPFNAALWVAQGFGVGRRVPFGPGTAGSVLGLLWFALLDATGSLWLYLAGTIAGLALSVWLCGIAERLLKETDPSSVVLDEITALPVCFLPWVFCEWHRRGTLPSPTLFGGVHTWYVTVGIFFLFRVFDILKPWPICQSQRLPGGWGVTVDDLLAAIAVALVSLSFVR